MCSVCNKRSARTRAVHGAPPYDTHRTASQIDYCKVLIRDLGQLIPPAYYCSLPLASLINSVLLTQTDSTACTAAFLASCTHQGVFVPNQRAARHLETKPFVKNSVVGRTVENATTSFFFCCCYVRRHGPRRRPEGLDIIKAYTLLEPYTEPRGAG